MKKFLILTLLISILGITQYHQTQAASAADGSRFDPGNIIDDRSFTDTTTMSVAQIQNFLNTVNGSGSTCLKNYQTTKPLGGGNYGENVSAAQAIFDVSQLYGLNPQVIIVTLQKEQGLITTTNCSESKYRSAMGFGCPDTAPCDTQWYGLSKQLFQGARHLKGFYNNSLTFVPFKVGTYYIGWHPNSSCGGTNVSIKTRGTAALYSYTPYQPNSAALGNIYGSGNSCSSYGNRNFWAYFSDWFGSPTGDLVRTVNNATVYLVSDGKKFPISTLSLLSDFGVLGPLNYVDQSYLDAIPSTNPLERMVGSTDGSTLYLITAGIKLPFPSCQSVADYGFSCASVPRLTPTQLSSFVNGPPVTTLIKSNVDATVYYVKNGQKRPIGSWQDLVALNIGYGINVLTDPFLATLPIGDVVLTGGSLLKVSNSATVYAVNDWEGSPSLFPVISFSHTIDLGLGTGVRTVSAGQLSRYSISSTLKTAVKCGTNSYIGSEGVLYKISPSQFTHFGYTSANFLTSGDICNRFTISPTPMSQFIFNKGTVYYVENGTKRGFTSYNAYIAHGGASNPRIPVSDAFINSMPNGSPISS